MGKVKGFILNRKTYDRIRRMDHCQMTLWAESIFKSGYEQGQKDAEGLSLEEVKEVLSQQKGIGEKRTAMILQGLEEKMAAK